MDTGKAYGEQLKLLRGQKISTKQFERQCAEVRKRSVTIIGPLRELLKQPGCPGSQGR
jgi:hypothetical protein